MASHACSRFQVKSWDEQPYGEVEGLPKLTRVSATYSYEGDIEGNGAVEFLMMYREDGSASFSGMERVTGRIGDRAGTFVFQGGGTFESNMARGSWQVVAGSGTGDLRGLRGEATMVATVGQEAELTLEYTFE
jgi:hypothetical protein